MVIYRDMRFAVSLMLGQSVPVKAKVKVKVNVNHTPSSTNNQH